MADQSHAACFKNGWRLYPPTSRNYRTRFHRFAGGWFSDTAMIMRATEAAIRQRCQEFAAWTVEATANGLDSYFAAVAAGSPTTDEEELASSCSRTLSQICDQLYFGSSAFRSGQREDEEGLQAIDARKAFLDDVLPALRRIGDVGYRPQFII